MEDIDKDKETIVFAALILLFATIFFGISTLLGIDPTKGTSFGFILLSAILCGVGAYALWHRLRYGSW